jgi:hypothetical protein
VKRGEERLPFREGAAKFIGIKEFDFSGSFAPPSFVVAIALHYWRASGAQESNGRRKAKRKVRTKF